MGVPIALGYREDAASGAQIIDGGLRFSNSKSQRLTRTPSSAGNRRTWTFSCWYKKNLLDTGSAWISIFASYTNSSNYSSIGGYRNLLDDIGFTDYSSSSIVTMVSTNALIRDLSSWYHFVYAYDTTSSTSSDRIKIYINGVRQTSIYSGREVYPSQNYEGFINSTNLHTLCENIGYYGSDCQMSQVYFIDGQALDPSYFGFTDPLTNTWRPKKFKPQATPNDGTVWSSGTITNTGGGIYSGSWANVFDGDISNGVYVYSNSTTRLAFPKALSGLIEVYGSNGSNSASDSAGTDTIVLSDGSTYDVSAITQPNIVWYSFGQKTGITYIDVKHNSASGQGTFLRSIRVNGVPLLDSDITNMGANAFYLPLDGSAPIGQDQSGRGNNWTPVNFGGSNTIEKATGALPILNTDGGGKVARVGVRTDSSASSLVLALPLVGIKSDFSNAVNSGSTQKVVTANGSVSGITTVSNFYGGSCYLTGTAMRISASSDFEFTGDFTVEFWTQKSSYVRFATPFMISPDTSTTVTINMGDNINGWFFIVGSSNYSSSNSFTASQWTHLSICRQGSTVYCFINGILQSTFTQAGTVGSSSAQAYIGDYRGDNEYTYNGYLQDLRVYKGVAKYTSNFIPASTDPDIVPDSPSGVSYSSNLTQITDGAVAFDGSGDYLSIPSTSLSGDFCIEGFIYTNTSNNVIAFTMGDSYATSDGLLLYVSSDDAMRIISNGSIVIQQSPLSFTKGAWDHFALTRSGSTIKLFRNGVQVGSNWTSSTTFTGILYLGVERENSAFNRYLNGFLSNVRMVNGSPVYTTNFTPPSAPLTNITNTTLLCCKSPTSATVFDVSPGTITAVNALATNFNPFTTDINTQRGKQSGYATWDPLSKQANCTLSNGNLNWASTSTTSVISIANIGMSSGKWYCEHTCTSGNNMFGLHRMAGTLPTNYVGGNADNWGYYADNGNKYNNNSNSSYGSSFTPGDVISVAFDADAGTLTFYKNGISQGVAYTGLTNGPYTFAIGNGGASSGTPNATSNFGQKPFKFPPPAGFQPLTLANTPRPTIVRPDQYVGIVTYVGTGTTQSINVGFQPDFVWFKSRSTSGAGYNNIVFDSVRGSSKSLAADLTSSEYTGTDFTSFDSKGFTVGAVNQWFGVNNNTTSFVAWAWKAGGQIGVGRSFMIDNVGFATAGDAGMNTGTITPTGASVNKKSGFSIVTYTGARASATTTSDTFGHGLGRAPSFIILKSRNTATTDWIIYHAAYSVPSNAWYAYNSFFTFTTSPYGGTGNTYPWGNTSPSSTVVTVNNASSSQTFDANRNDRTYVAYCWAEIPGFSKFGSYSGGSNPNFVYLGFRPRYVMIKRTDTANYWIIQDAVRNTYNQVNLKLAANDSVVENDLATIGDTTQNQLDFVSNGFVCRSTNAGTNASGGTYIYCAFAESPAINLYGAQANAR